MLIAIYKHFFVQENGIKVLRENEGCLTAWSERSRLDQRRSKGYQPVGTSAGIVAAYVLKPGLEI